MSRRQIKEAGSTLDLVSKLYVILVIDEMKGLSFFVVSFFVVSFFLVSLFLVSFFLLNFFLVTRLGRQPQLGFIAVTVRYTAIPIR